MFLAHLLLSLEHYLHQQCSLRDIGELLLTRLQDILDSGDQQTISLANHIDADLIEHGEDLIDETTLRARFEHYLASHPLPFQYSTNANSESDVIFTPVGVPGAEVTIHFRHVWVA